MTVKKRSLKSPCRVVFGKRGVPGGELEDGSIIKSPTHDEFGKFKPLGH